MKKAFWIIFVYFLISFISVTKADFELKNYVMSITINQDGNAYCSEDFLIFLSDKYTTKVYEDSLVLNDLASWQERIKINDLRTHINRAYVDVEDIVVRPTPIFNCNNIANTCFGKITIEYKIKPLVNSKYGIVQINNYKPRMKEYIFMPKVLSFQTTKDEESIILPQGYSLKITIPENANKIAFSITPNNIPEDPALFKFDPQSSKTYYIGKERMFIWQGRTLSKFYLSYEIEQQIEDEVKDYLKQLQASSLNLIFTLLHIPYFIVFVSYLILIIWLNRLNEQKLVI